MIQQFLPQLPPLQAFSANGIVRSSFYDDLYFSADNGLEESRHVFLGGTELTAQISICDHLVIAETGFGTGLNFLALYAEMKRLGASCQIDYISFEASPLTCELVQAAHAPFLEIQDISKEMLAQWPRRWPGVHRLSFGDGQLRVQLHYGRAEEVMPRLDFLANIWFLDGFSPAKNPALWSKDICREIARLSAPKACLASYTVARQVRDNLSQAGFQVKKVPGYGRKREMLTARYDKGFHPARPSALRQAAIIGGGIAGAAMGHAFSQLNIPHHIFEAGEGLASGASGNPAGVLVPFLSVGDMPASRLSISALAYSRHFVDRAGLVKNSGVISLDFSEQKKNRQEKLAAQDFPSDLAQYLTRDEVDSLCGINTGLGGLYHQAGAVISPVDYCNTLAQNSDIITRAKIISVAGEEGNWQLTCDDGRIFSADYIVFCGGADLPSMPGIDSIEVPPHQITSGQLSFLPPTTGLSRLKMTLNYSGYALPAGREMQIIGAGFDFDIQKHVTQAGHQQNLDFIPPSFRHLAGLPDGWAGRVSRRFAVADRLPLCGEISPTRSVLSALGARGLTLAGFLGQNLAYQIAGLPPLLDRPLRAALDPKRFFIKGLSP